MIWKVLKTEDDYNKASMRLMEIFHAEANTSESDELELLMVLEVIKYKMQEMGLKNKDLEPIIGSKGHVSAVLSGKREITLKMAQKLKNYFSIPAEIFLHSA